MPTSNTTIAKKKIIVNIFLSNIITIMQNNITTQKTDIYTIIVIDQI